MDNGKAIAEKAYFNFINRSKNGSYGDSLEDWAEAEREIGLDERIKEEAYFLHQKYGGTTEQNWEEAKKNVQERLQFLAFYLHEGNIDISPMQNWLDAQKLYLTKF